MSVSDGSWQGTSCLKLEMAELRSRFWTKSDSVLVIVSEKSTCLPVFLLIFGCFDSIEGSILVRPIYLQGPDLL